MQYLKRKYEFPEGMKHTTPQIWGAQRVTNIMSPKKNTKCEDKVLRGAREKRQITYKGVTPKIRNTVDISTGTRSPVEENHLSKKKQKR
jgi:hypothetical protein